jgi:hypothetical protein
MVFAGLFALQANYLTLTITMLMLYAELFAYGAN